MFQLYYWKNAFYIKISQMECELNYMTVVSLVQSIWPTMKNEFDVHAVVKHLFRVGLLLVFQVYCTNSISPTV